MGIGNILGASVAMGVTANITETALKKTKKIAPNKEYKKTNSRKIKGMDIMRL